MLTLVIRLSPYGFLRLRMGNQQLLWTLKERSKDTSKIFGWSQGAYAFCFFRVPC